MNDQKFFDLAMKVVAGQPTDAERIELDSLMARQPELRSELEKLRRDSQIARGILPLVAATESSSGEFPGYARERLQAKVRQTLLESARNRPLAGLNWRWVLGLATGAAVVVFIFISIDRRSEGPVIEVAMLDTGTVRGANTTDATVFAEKWKNSKIQRFESEESLRSWETNSAVGGGRIVRVVYDRAAGEVCVFRIDSGRVVEKAFAVETHLSKTLKLVDQYIRSNM